VIVATDDGRIAEAARGFGATIALTDAAHRSGTERIAEVARLRGWSGDAVVVNLQGDSPLMPPSAIAQVARLLVQHPHAALATLCTRITSAEEYANPNVVKVVKDATGRALYFSRASIPSVAHGGSGLPEAWRHLGLYAYRVASLERLSRAEPCVLETVEKLEQLRALWLGMEIRIAEALDAHGPDVDAPEDVARVEQYLQPPKRGS
jgi:3-deoxy-manno-octulosonate cytidylyltransferase (CMP-KDO synthetase)